MADSALLNSLLEVIQDFESDYRDKLHNAYNTIEDLKEANRQLHEELEKGTTILDEATDEILRKRLSSLESSPLDTLVREAGVVLEDRLRRIAGKAGVSLHGEALVNAVLAPDKGTLVFSKHSTEQLGVLKLYQGAMQFIRNPPMHNLIEYQASTTQILVRLIDSLLRLLAEVESPEFDTEEVKLGDVRRMLKRIPVPPGQRLLYQALLKVGEKGASSSELAATLNRTRPQLAGILGALGARINGTEGLENKGGVMIVLDISILDDKDYLYRMRPILRKALEMEKVLKAAT